MVEYRRLVGERGLFTTGTRPREDIGDETPPEYLDVWSALSERGLNVITIRDKPRLLRERSATWQSTALPKAGPHRLRNAPPGGAGRVNSALEPASRNPNICPVDISDAVCEPTVCGR
ncbi:hypothetical protein [Nocardia gamkensis]|uniref:Uncharacterized protein n=1 Tax=Nocardia gamkensis TaxID=352869 RepID=A0A7X6L157_9NOCA|nr:hypothetical protein [Nocardia gamkensis]NKY25876.1 hypothetical protein [Nocardia gamkensis]